MLQNGYMVKNNNNSDALLRQIEGLQLEPQQVALLAQQLQAQHLFTQQQQQQFSVQVLLDQLYPLLHAAFISLAVI